MSSPGGAKFASWFRWRRSLFSFYGFFDSIAATLQHFAALAMELPVIQSIEHSSPCLASAEQRPFDYSALWKGNVARQTS